MNLKLDNNPRSSGWALPALQHLLLLTSLAGIVACGSSGGVAGGGGTGCNEQEGNELGGTWNATGTVIELDESAGDVYIPCGLDNLTFSINFEQGAEEQGICTLLYAATSSTLDTASPSGGPSTMLALTASNMPSGIFSLTGMLYYPGGDVTTSFDANVGSIQVLSPSSFLSVIEFEVYEGDQIALVDENEPDVDDDGDGQIDEADELGVGDGIAADAVVLCRGRMQLTISRGAGSALSSTVLRPEPQTFTGVLAATNSHVTYPTRITLDTERELVFLQSEGIMPAGGCLQLVAPIHEDGSFATSAEQGLNGIRFSGQWGAWISVEIHPRGHAAQTPQILRLESGAVWEPLR